MIRNVVVILIVALASVAILMPAQAQERDEWGKLCYTHSDGWRLSLTGGEVDVEEAKNVCIPACAGFKSYKEMDENLDKVGSKMGVYFYLYRTIYRDWNDEQERAKQSNEKPVEYRYLACALDLPVPSEGKSVSLTSRAEVTIKVRETGTGQIVELTSIAVLGTSDYKRQLFCWDSRKSAVVKADPKKFCSKGNTILLFAMFPDVFDVKDIKEVSASGFQVVEDQVSWARQ